MNLAELSRSTTFRWSLAVAAALLVQSAALASFFYILTARHAVAEVDQALADDCRSVAGMGRDALMADVRRRIAADVHRVHLVGLFTPQGDAVAGNIAKLPPALVTNPGPLVVGLVRTEPPDPVPNPSRSIACRTSDGDRIVFAHDTDESEYISTLARRALLIVAFPALVLAGGLGLLLAGRAQARFSSVQGAIDRFMAGDIGVRLPVTSALDPVGRLSAAVNTMLDKFEVTIGELRGLGDDIAHELRTPLTRLRARLERGCHEAESRDEFRAIGERAITEIDHALSIVSAILRIRAIEQSKRGSEFKEVDLAVILRDAADLYRPIAESKSLIFAIEAKPIVVTADRDLLMEAVCNLLDNAIKFTAPGGRVTCSISQSAAGRPLLRIVDNGPGIPQGERPLVTRRFHRGPRQDVVDGHGIGLSLVAAIIHLHRFDLELNDAHPGCEAVILCSPQQSSII